MIGDAFVEMRLLGWESRSERVADLAEAFHNIPMEMYDPRNFNWDEFRGRLEFYCRKWKGEPWLRDYVTMLDEIRLKP
jgi:hypothetical protein